MNSFKKCFVLILILLFLSGLVCGETDKNSTKVVLLGTGNPNPDPGHSGCSIAIIVNDTPYIVDFGPGLIRKAAKMSLKYGGSISGLDIKNIKTAFLTHLHSDHTTGYPDLILTPWVMGRDEPLKVFGPEGLGEMTRNVLKAYQEDIKYRLYGLEPANNLGWRVKVKEISEGEIFQDKNVKVTAFKVEHGSWPNAFGFRFSCPDKVIVISGDTRPCSNLIKFSKGADILIHEVYSKKGWEKKTKFWKKYHLVNHTSTLELAQIAKQIKPKKLVLYHTLYWGSTDQDLLDEIKKVYQGEVIAGSDLQIIE